MIKVQCNHSTANFLPLVQEFNWLKRSTLSLIHSWLLIETVLVTETSLTLRGACLKHKMIEWYYTRLTVSLKIMLCLASIDLANLYSTQVSINITGSTMVTLQ